MIFQYSENQFKDETLVVFRIYFKQPHKKTK